VGQVGAGRAGRWRVGKAVTCIAFALALAAPMMAQTSQTSQTTFRASVDVTSLDVTVVDDRGKPIADLTPADFVVRIDGSARKVVTAEWVPLATPASEKPIAPVPEGYSSNESSTGGRLIVIAVDERNIRFGGGMAIARAANAFIDRLTPADRVAVAGFGIGAPATVFTADRERVKRVIARMVGQKQPGRMLDLGHNIALVEAQAIERGDQVTYATVLSRECPPVTLTPIALEVCRQQVDMEARTMAQEVRTEADQTISDIRNLLLGLSRIDAPKTMILISEGFVLSDESLIIDLGTLAAQARTSVYTLKLDSQLFEITDRRVPVNPFADRQARSEGLELLAGAARGTLFTVTGTGQPLFERIESELSGYYLLGVESEPRDHDGKSRGVRVDVSRRGATVRTRRQVLNAKSDRPAPRSPRAAVVAALSSPLLSSALPLRVASFSLQGPEAGKVQVLIQAEIGSEYASSKAVAVGYLIADKDGRQVDTKAEVVRVSPPLTGVPSALRYTAGASVPPGDYSLKLAIAEGERVGTVEHTIHAGLESAGALKVSELMVGGPTEVGELLKPTIGYDVTFGSVHGYVEAYGSGLDALTMEYEIATDPTAPALLNVDVPPRPAGDTRVIFTRVMPIHQLPPGKYFLRAILSSDGRSISTATREFSVASPKVLMTSAEGVGTNPADSELFLPVDDETMSPKFRREEATSADVIKEFAEHVEDGAKPAIEEGIAFLAAGDYVKAELSLKRAIQPEFDSTAALVYLAAAFAASGHDTEAASAWQTALVDGSELPRIYHWLGGALLRSRDYNEARAILEEAAGKWPADARFLKPLAMLYGTAGRGREAVRTLERYIEEQRADRDAYYMAVQWIYMVRSAGASVHSPAEDLKLAQTYADAYAKASGPQAALVRQWVDYLRGNTARD
jgi:VWFA-related protein